MAISERARNSLYNSLTKAIGSTDAETLMRAFPLHDLDEVATKGDIALVNGEIALVRGEMAAMEAGLLLEIERQNAATRDEMHKAIGETHKAIGELRASMHRWNMTLFLAVIGAMASFRFIG